MTSYASREAMLGRPLSDREHQALREVARGRSSKQIARTLDITPTEASEAMKRVLAKLGVARATAAVLKAERTGLLQGVEV